MNNEKYNGFHVPDTREVNMKDVQVVYCSTSTGCIDNCNQCLFDAGNLSEFEKYFNSNLKNDNNEC